MALRAIVIAIVTLVAAVSWAATCALHHFREVAAGIEPLEPRSFETLTVVTVGTGTAYENPQRLGPAILVGTGSELLLVDAGRGVAEALRGARIPVSQPRTVLLTSLLPENVVGLDDLLFTGWIEGREAPLRIVGPPGTRMLTQHLEQAHAPALRSLGQALGLAPEAARLEAVEVSGPWEEERGALRVRARGLRGGPVPALGYRFEASGATAVVGGVGWDEEGLIELARGADLWVHEALHGASVDLAIEAGVENPDRLRREAALHTHTEAVGALAERAAVGTVVLVRLRPPPLYELQFRSLVGERFSGRVIVAEDGEEIPVRR